ncbi:MAG: exodeoxyribonuclease VII small subunit [Proteobacteria bacterium]|nr:exodeoxyribonuclease VII small subunit [Pseudomonadota bacterium]
MTQPSPADLTFEDALQELEGIVGQLERGDVALEDTIARFERGMALARRCEDRLGEAEKKVALLLREGDRVVEVDMASGKVLTETHDPGEALLPGAPQEPAHVAAAQQSLLDDDDDDLPF